MVFVIGESCVDLQDRSCTQVCPVDCIYEGDRKLYINPDECIDCGACEPACPAQAIFIDDDAPDGEEWAIADNRTFFTDVLVGRSEPLGKPGGSRKLGRIGVDTLHVVALPRRAVGARGGVDHT